MSDCRSLWILCGGCCRTIRRKLRGACRAQYSLAFYKQSLRCVHNIPSGHKAVADPLLTARSARRDVSVYNNVRSAENHRSRAARKRNDIARNFFECAVFYIFICSVKAQRRHDRLFGAGVHALFGLRRNDCRLRIFPGEQPGFDTDIGHSSAGDIRSLHGAQKIGLQNLELHRIASRRTAAEAERGILCGA